MKVIYWCPDKPRESVLAREFIKGVNEAGDDGEVRPRSKVSVGGYDVAVLTGVKSREIWRMLRAANVPVVLVDQGYFKETKYHRVAVNAHHPTRYLNGINYSSERWDSFRIPVRPWRKNGEYIVIAGGSEKYHRFYNLPHPTRYYAEIVERLRESGRPIIYRPKPSWRDAEPITGTIYSHRRKQEFQTLGEALRNAHALVTHGSNACFEAMIYGVPSIVLGDGIAKSISSTSLDDIDSPKIATDAERMQLLSNLAWCQFSWVEFKSGIAWKHIRTVIDAGDLLSVQNAQ